jgi:hypothetical protein
MLGNIQLHVVFVFHKTEKPIKLMIELNSIIVTKIIANGVIIRPFTIKTIKTIIPLYTKDHIPVPVIFVGMIPVGCPVCFKPRIEPGLKNDQFIFY